MVSAWFTSGSCQRRVAVERANITDPVLFEDRASFFATWRAYPTNRSGWFARYKVYWFAIMSISYRPPLDFVGGVAVEIINTTTLVLSKVWAILYITWTVAIAT